jgi:S-formylglutathione hydrolase FrmB
MLTTFSGRGGIVGVSCQSDLMQPWYSSDLSGRVDDLTISSDLLRDNPLGDPHERPLSVYTPPGYDDAPDRRYPSVYVIQGYSGFVTSWFNRRPFRASFPEEADQLFAEDGAPPAIVVYVDAWTAYGGSQFVDSPGTGPYHSYLCDEVVPYVDARYRTLAAPEHRGIAGKSSGGFGAMITPMLRPDLFGGLATHAGDALYEGCYIPEFLKIVRQLRDYDGDIFRWWERFQAGERSPDADADLRLAMILAVAACFSPDADGRPELPFDPRSGLLRPDAWQRWLDWDPVRMAPKYADALRSQRAIWIDGGTKDEWYLDLGAQAFRDAIGEVGVSDEVVHFEILEDLTHFTIDRQYVRALAWLSTRLSPPA